MAAPDSPANAATAPAAAAALVVVDGLTMAFGTHVVQRDLRFEIRRGEILAIIGPSGCGKSTLLRHLIGLTRPAAGTVRYGGEDFFAADDPTRARLQRRLGVSFQAGALWSSMTVGENVMLPMALFTRLDAAAQQRRARFKLALVGLADAFDLEPSALSGGMRKRAAIARALALDPLLLYLDEPSAGLDPLTSARLDTLIAQLRAALGTTVVMVTHELASIFAVADRVLYLDPEEKTMTALDAPATLRDSGPPPVRQFLRRGAAA